MELQLKYRESLHGTSLFFELLHAYAGKADFNRVLTVEQSLTDQQDQLAVAQGSVAKTLVQLYKALGGGWQPVGDTAAGTLQDARS